MRETVKNVLVNEGNYSDALRVITSAKTVAIDTETTGLDSFARGHRLFSVAVSCAKVKKSTNTRQYINFYFNFNDEPDYTGGESPNLLDRALIRTWAKAFRDKTLFLHNAKFDIHMLRHEHLNLLTTGSVIHCTMAQARIVENDLTAYGLDYLGNKYLGITKIDEVKKCVEKNKLYAHVDRPGKDKKEKLKRYELVPYFMMSRYAMRDTEMTYKLGHFQLAKIKEAGLEKVSHVEAEITKVTAQMEWLGIKINREFCNEGIEHYSDKMHEILLDWREKTGVKTITGRKDLVKALTDAGVTLEKTAKGNPSLDEKAFSKMDSPLVDIILDYRDAQKKVGTYFGNFLWFADSQDKIHTSLVQTGAATCRFSSRSPNLQNVSKVEEGDEGFADKYLLRRAFIPGVNEQLLMIDYDQMEYRLMLDLAQEMGVIEEILGGLDVHTATANMVGITRKYAKTLNFMLLYGGGIAKICQALFEPTLKIETLQEIEYMHTVKDKSATQISNRFKLEHSVVLFNLRELNKARELREKYFKNLPAVKTWIDKTKYQARTYREIHNWYGMRYVFKPGFDYVAPNHVIQGGCAYIIKLAMIDIAKFLKPLRTEMLLQVHDELLFGLHGSESGIVPELVRIMEEAYPAKHLPLTCGVDYSDVSWQDKKPWPKPLKQDSKSESKPD